MRYGCAALLMLISFAVTASAQAVSRPAPNGEIHMTPDQMIARVLSFDRNRDGRIALDELAERMQGLVARGDSSGDGALDAAEIRTLVVAPQTVPVFRATVTAPQGGGYGFGDVVGQSSRTHIDNTIDDLRLAPWTNSEAKRLAAAFADQLEVAAFANLLGAVTPLLTEPQLPVFAADVRRSMNSPAFNGRSVGGFAAGIPTDAMLKRFQLTPEQTKAAQAAIEIYKSAQQLDDARRSTLVARVSHLLTEEDRDDFRAALARRPLVKGAGLLASVQPMKVVQGHTINAVVR